MKTSEVQSLYSEFILPTYAQTALCLVRGRGSRVWDLEGREYLDFFPGWAVSGLGHCHPAVVSALRAQAGKILHISNNFLNLKQGELAAEIVKRSFPARVFFASSGAEVNDAAIKFARRFGSDGGRFEIITMKRSFHGRTLATLTATGQAKVQQGFDPLPAGFHYAEYNDLDSVRSLVSDKTVAVMLEPLLGEGGIEVATREFMQGLRALCDERNMLLILDEVQTGMGRTGRWFAYQHYGMEPDIMTLGKSLGNGAPLSALVVNRRIEKEVFTPGTHGSTYGGNPLVCAAGLAVFKTIQKEALIRRAQELGDYFGSRLEAMCSEFALVKEVRGRGLMRALVLDRPGAFLVEKAREQGLLINCTQERILRLLPALTIPKRQLDRGLSILKALLASADKKAAVTLTE